MPKKILLILNPTANHAAAEQAFASLRPELEKLGAVIRQTERRFHAVELAHQAAGQGCDLVIAAGGDGTVHEVINGLMLVPPKDRPALGILPLGSGNDFAHILGVPDDITGAFQSCLSGEAHILDVGSVRDGEGRLEYFNNTIGIGFDAAVTIHSRKITAIHGFMMYFLATMQTIIKNFTPLDVHVETEAESWDETMIMLMLGNGPREGGGFIVAPEARLDDGILNYCTIRRISRLTMFRLVPEFMKGTQGRFNQVRMGTCKRLTVNSRQPLYVHLDGEIYAGFDTQNRQLSIEVQPGAIRFMKK